ncbi:unnamed protein product, partial [Darwinula stevensoni]
PGSKRFGWGEDLECGEPRDGVLHEHPRVRNQSSSRYRYFLRRVRSREYVVECKYWVRCRRRWVELQPTEAGRHHREHAAPRTGCLFWHLLRIHAHLGVMPTSFLSLFVSPLKDTKHWCDGAVVGTLNPALQDKQGRPRRDISTIIHILNDLLCATPHYSPGRQQGSAAAASLATAAATPAATVAATPASMGVVRPPTPPPPLPTTSVEKSCKVGVGEDMELENAVIRHKVEQLRLVLEERRARRKARREQRAPYPTSTSLPASALFPDPGDASGKGSGGGGGGSQGTLTSTATWTATSEAAVKDQNGQPEAEAVEYELKEPVLSGRIEDTLRKFFVSCPPESEGMQALSGDLEFGEQQRFEAELQSLSQGYSKLGLGSFYTGDGSVQVDWLSLVHSSWEVLMRFASAQKTYGELEDKHHRIAYQLRDSQEQNRQMLQEVDALERKLVACKEQLRQKEELLKQCQKCLKHEREDFRKRKALFEHQEKQIQHRVKKLSLEKDKIDRHRGELLCHKPQINKGSMQLLNPLSRNEYRRPQWKTPSSSERNEQELRQHVREKLENRYLGLRQENAEMRKLLFHFYSDLASLHKGPKCQSALSLVDSVKGEGRMMKEVCFGLSWDASASLIASKLNEIFGELRLRLHQVSTKSPSSPPNITKEKIDAQTSPREKALCMDDMNEAFLQMFGMHCRMHSLQEVLEAPSSLRNPSDPLFFAGNPSLSPCISSSSLSYDATTPSQPSASSRLPDGSILPSKYFSRMSAPSPSPDLLESSDTTFSLSVYETAEGSEDSSFQAASFFQQTSDRGEAVERRAGISQEPEMHEAVTEYRHRIQGFPGSVHVRVHTSEASGFSAPVPEKPYSPAAGKKSKDYINDFSEFLNRKLEEQSHGEYTGKDSNLYKKATGGHSASSSINDTPYPSSSGEETQYTY